MSGLFFAFGKRLSPYRQLIFLLGDFAAAFSAVWLAFLLRFDGHIPQSYFQGSIASAIVLISF